MAVRVTAGRITIAALLAAGLGLVSYTMPEAGPAQRAQLVDGQCNSSGYRYHELDIPIIDSYPTPYSVSPNLPAGATLNVSGGQFCKRTCDAAKADGDPAGNSCSTGSCLMAQSCAPTYVPTIGGQYVYVYDLPLSDNGPMVPGGKMCPGSYLVYDPTCTSSTGGGIGGTDGGSSTPTSSTSSYPSSHSSSHTSASSHSSTSSTSSGGIGGGIGGTTGGGSSTPATSSTPTTSASSHSSTSSTSSGGIGGGIGGTTGGGSSTSSTSFISSSSSSSSDSSSSSSSWGAEECGDGVVQNTGPGPDGVTGNADDMEQCDDGNDDDYDECKNDCTVPATCGDGIIQPAGPDGFLTPEADRYGEAYAASDDEECDAGPANGNVDYQNGGCKANCKLPECSNGRPEKGLLHGGTEWIEDNLKDADDGGCHEKTVNGQVVLCDLNAPYMKGKDSESNPCQLAGPGDGSKSVGETCSVGGECAGNSNGSVLCINTYGSQGTCTQVMSSDGQGANLLAQGVGGAPAGQFPQCPPIPGCNMMVGDPVGCAPFGGLDKDTCASQTVRRQCLQATAQQQCVNGVVVPVPIGADWSCSQGDPANPQWMCGPAGQWFCKCPNDPNPPLWQENLQPCPPPPAVCGDKHVDPGEDCDDGNKVDDDACSNACKFNGGACRGNECDNPAAIAACKADGGKICKPDNQLPCIKCVPPVVGVCKGDECMNGGSDFCKKTGEECSLTDKAPCITCIGPNQCGNGRIDLEKPTEVDQGCTVTGTSNQLCMPEGVEPGDQGAFQDSDRCYQGAHCQSVNGSCSWEMTPELQQCLAENGGGLPEGCFCEGNQVNNDCAVVFGANPCAGGGPLGKAAPSRLTAQVGGGATVCATDIRSCCGDDGNTFWVSRDPTNNCSFPACNQDFSRCGAAAAECVRAGCNGSQCVPRDQVTASPWCGVDPKAACYDMGTCGAKPGGGCGWLPNAAFDECLNDNTAGTCPSDASCLTRAACDDSGGTAGNACGADDTNVCCSGGADQPKGPVEQCDDGNQIDDDACGNDCQINCTKNADCPEGACVKGQCVDQCVEPDAGDGGANAGGNAPQPPAQGCGEAFPLCREGDPIVGIDNPPCPPFHHVENGPASPACGANGNGQCYRCIPDICPAVPAECVNLCSRAFCPTGCCGKDPATGQCGCNAMPSPQGFLPKNDFLSRLMAQQVPSNFRLLP